MALGQKIYVFQAMHNVWRAHYATTVAASSRAQHGRQFPTTEDRVAGVKQGTSPAGMYGALNKRFQACGVGKSLFYAHPHR